MIVKTKRFGDVEYDPKTAIVFPKGILGFPKEKRFVLLDPNKKSPLKWLQSLDRPDLAFVITDPLIFKPEYEIKAFKSDLEELEAEDFTHITQFVIVTVPHDPSKMTANLKGPLLVNLENNLAKQLVLDDNSLSLKFRLIPEEKARIAG
ncbi:MAG: flagellar assembly protein FliW [Candidatus Cloacimonadota bacterium]|nr:MAG: flagellar assembly protein FliW [Candidatus Cloacimonadota bacterium]